MIAKVTTAMSTCSAVQALHKLLLYAGSTDGSETGSDDGSPLGPKGGGTLKTCAICLEDYRHGFETGWSGLWPALPMLTIARLYITCTLHHGALNTIAWAGKDRHDMHKAYAGKPRFLIIMTSICVCIHQLHMHTSICICIHTGGHAPNSTSFRRDINALRVQGTATIMSCIHSTENCYSGMGRS